MSLLHRGIPVALVEDDANNHGAHECTGHVEQNLVIQAVRLLIEEEACSEVRKHPGEPGEEAVRGQIVASFDQLADLRQVEQNTQGIEQDEATCKKTAEHVKALIKGLKIQRPSSSYLRES